MRATYLVVAVTLGCSKPAPTADCDAFATQYTAKVSSPSDGELTKKAIEVDVLTMKSRCSADKWSPALADCIVKSPKDVSKACASQFTPEQLQHLTDVRKQQADGMRDAIKDSLSR